MDGQKVSTARFGVLHCQPETNKGERLIVKLKDALFIPYLNGKLISVEKLTAKGLNVHFKGSMCTILNKLLE